MLSHEPVLLDEVIGGLNLKKGDTALDLTGGAGGHSESIVNQVGSSGRCIVMDQDSGAIEMLRSRFKGAVGIEFIHENFRNLNRVMRELRITEVQAVLMDLGLSSMQLDDPSRGFAFRFEGDLDMRMNPLGKKRLSYILDELSQESLANSIYQYGEERYSRRIARAIKEALKKEQIHNSKDLSDIIVKAVPAHSRHGRIHAATRSFQAFRILVNDELAALEEGLEASHGLLAAGGRMAVISFHSLEDRIVKNAFKEFSKKKTGIIITKKPVTPQAEELKSNARSRSAKLRIFEKQYSGEGISK